MFHEGPAHRGVFDRVPDHHRACRETRMNVLDLLQDSLEFRALLEGRVDEDEAAAYLGRQHGFERAIAVHFEGLDALVAAEEGAEARVILGVEFAKSQAILRSYKQRGDHWRAGVEFRFG